VQAKCQFTFLISLVMEESFSPGSKSFEMHETIRKLQSHAAYSSNGSF